MNKLQRWERFKLELPSLIYLCVIQTYLNFTFPVFIRLGKPLYIVMATLLSILSISVYIYTFLFADKFIGRINQEYFDDVPNPLRDILKKSENIWLIIISHIGFIYVWYYNIYHIHSIHYGVYYIHFIITLYLISRVIKRSQLSGS